MLQHVELKQRIIGGIVLVSLAVILVPFLMDDPRQEVKLLESNVPAWPDDLPLTTIEIDEKDFSPIREPAAVSPPPATNKPTEQKKEAKPATNNKKEPAPKSLMSKATPAPTTKPTATTKSGGKYEVQVASYSEKNRKIAERFLKKMESKGYQAQLRAVKLKGKKWLRLITTVPLTSKKAATELKQRIDQDFKRDGVRSTIRSLK